MSHNGSRKEYVWGPSRGFTRISLVLLCTALLVNGQLYHLWPVKGKTTKDSESLGRKTGNLHFN